MAAIGLKIGKAIYNILSGDSNLVSLVGGVTKIQPSAIYTSSPSKGIFYDILSVDNDNTKTSNVAEITSVIFQIECFMPKYADAVSVGVRVQELLDKLTNGEYNSIKVQSCVLQSQSTDFDGDNKLYYIQSTFKARIIN